MPSDSSRYRLPPLRALQAFEAVARLGSHRRAADALSVTLSAVSHRIKALEEWVGFPLFDRKHRQLQLNDSGRAYAEAVSTCFAGLHDATRRLVQNRSAGVVSIGAIPSFATRALIPRLQHFWQQNPNVALRVRYAMYQGETDLKDLDFLIWYGPADAWPNHHVDRLLPGVWLPVCSPEYLERHGPIARPQDLCNAVLLYDDVRTSWETWFARADLADAALPNGPMFEDFSMMYASTMAGHGVALCPVDLVREELDEGRLVQLFDIPVNEDHGYHLVSNAGDLQGLSPENAALRRWLIEQFT